MGHQLITAINHWVPPVDHLDGWGFPGMQRKQRGSFGPSTSSAPHALGSCSQYEDQQSNGNQHQAQLCSERGQAGADHTRSFHLKPP